MTVRSGGHVLVRTHMESLWQHSLEVAALSQVLARKLTKLKPDEAMLAGLLHDIGKLYILSRSHQHPELFANPQALEDVLENWHPGVGSAILRSWKFDEALVMVADEHEIIERTYGGSADLTDVVGNGCQPVGTRLAGGAEFDGLDIVSCHGATQGNARDRTGNARGVGTGSDVHYAGVGRRLTCHPGYVCASGHLLPKKLSPEIFTCQ